MKVNLLLQPLMKAVSDSVILFDHRRSVLFMNNEAERLTGYTMDEAEGLPFSVVCRLVDQPTRTLFQDLPDKAEASGGFLELAGVTVMESKNGQERLVKGALFVIPAGDDLPAGGLVVSDVTSQWMIGTAALRSRSVELIRTLIKGMVYNQDDLLTALLSTFSAIERSIGDPAGLRRQLAEAERIVGRISTVSSGMLSACSAEDSGQKVTKTVSVISDCLAGVQAAYPEIVIEVAYPDRTGFAAIQPDLFGQVLDNYLVNAVESQDGSGRIRLSACRLDLAEEMKPIPPGSYVMVGVRDYGPGISTEDLTRIFEPFFSTKGNDRGLGLASAWSIIHNFRGFITVSSESGDGSCFGVYIPAAPGMEVETASDRLPSVSLVGFTDEAEVEDLLMKLESVGCTRFREGGELEPAGPGLTVVRMNGADDPRWTGNPGGVPASAVLLALEEEEEPPEGADGTVRYINRPYTIMSVMEAVASIFWEREPLNTLEGSGSTPGWVGSA